MFDHLGIRVILKLVHNQFPVGTYPIKGMSCSYHSSFVHFIMLFVINFILITSHDFLRGLPHMTFANFLLWQCITTVPYSFFVSLFFFCISTIFLWMGKTLSHCKAMTTYVFITVAICDMVTGMGTLPHLKKNYMGYLAW